MSLDGYDAYGRFGVVGSSLEFLLLSNSALLIWRVSTLSSAEKASQNPEGGKERKEEEIEPVYSILWRLSQNAQLPGMKKATEYVIHCYLVCWRIKQSALCSNQSLVIPKCRNTFEVKNSTIMMLCPWPSYSKPKGNSCGMSCQMLQGDAKGSWSQAPVFDVWPLLIDVTHVGFNSFTWNGYSGISECSREFVPFNYLKW